MGRKSKKKEEEEEEEGEEVFHVEVITKARVVKAKRSGQAIWQYYVKWANFPESDNTWEPAENLSGGCLRLLESFWEHVGTDNKDYQVGYVVKAKKDWIEREKQFFKAESDKKLETERHEKKSKKRKREKSREATASTSTISLQEMSSTNETPLSSDSEDDRPLTESSKAIRIRIPKKVILSPKPNETPPSPRPQKIQKRHSAGFNVDNSTEDVNTLPNSPKQLPPNSRSQSPTSLFSDRSSPEVTLSSTVQPEKRTTSVSVPKAKPRNTRRVTDPQAKIASMPASALVTNSGITTKQRVAQGALNPKAPKEVATFQSTPKPLNRVPQLLSFKRRSLPTSVPPASIDTSRTGPTTTTGLRSPLVDDQTLVSLNSPALSAHSPQMLSGSFSSIAKPSAASSSIVANQHVVLPSRSSRQNNVISPASISSPTLSMSETESFLRDIMPSSLAAPLRPASETPSELMPPKPVAPKSTLPLPGRQPKLWSWSGPLQLTSTGSSICNVKLQQLLPTQGKALGFSVAFQNIEKIHVSCFYDVADFRANLDVFRNSPSLALLTSHEDKDTREFSIFSRYVEKAKKGFLLRIILDNNCIGQILFLAYAHGRLVFGTDLHSLYKRPDSLVAVVLPYALSVDNLQLATNIPRNLISTSRNFDQNYLQKKSNLVFEHGLRILGFSSQLYSYIKDRSFCIWPERSQGRSPAIETHFLTRILEKTRAPRVPCQSEARLVFVHVEELASLHKLPRFAERRAQQNYVQFYLYGTNAELSPYMSPVQEIYPCGGIVTFTPFAIRSDPLGVLQLIRRIDYHPLWSAYIVPSALGLLAKLECRQNDPLSELGEKPLMMDVILEAIQAGQLSLLEAAPEKPTVTRIVVQNKETGQEEIRYLEDKVEWAKKYVSFAPPRQLAALEAGVRAFLQNTKLSSESEGTAYMTVMDEITIADMALMQQNPVFMSSYRRFVVIDSDKPKPPRLGPYIQGLEWTPLNKFDFKDNFYPKQS